MNKQMFRSLNNYKRITLPSLIAIVLFGLILFLILHKLNYSFGVVEVTAYLTGTIAIVTLINFSHSIDKVNEHHEQTLKVNKDQYSFNVVAEIHKDYIKKSLQAFRHMNEKLSLADLPVKKLTDHFKDHPEDESHMVQVLNYFEHVSILIKWNQVEEKILKATFKTLFIRTRLLTKNYIELKQKDSHTLWSNYVKAAKRWEKK